MLHDATKCQEDTRKACKWPLDKKVTIYIYIARNQGKKGQVGIWEEKEQTEVQSVEQQNEKIAREKGCPKTEREGFEIECIYVVTGLSV